MSLQTMLEQLYTRRRFGIKPGVERVAGLLERLGNPESSFRTIHVVGTNGKGSTSAFLSAILLAAGYRTAQFSSPHLISFCERFRINGVDIPEDRCERHLASVLAAASGDETFFEIVTALAAYIFREERIDIAVIEAGMGGISDATAAFPGFMTVITPVSMDHTEYLGENPARIAAEKCAVAKPCTPVICAAQEDAAQEVISEFCRNNCSRLYLEGRDFQSTWQDSATLEYSGINTTLSSLSVGLPGRYQGQNAALALAAAEVAVSCGLPVSSEAFSNGLKSANWPGRMEFVEVEPTILLDGAHNPAGAAALVASLADIPHDRLLVVVGMCADKDVELAVEPLVALTDCFFAVTPAVERALSAVDLATILERLGAAVRPSGSVVDGIHAAKKEWQPGDLILVCGSLFVVGETRSILAGADYQGIRG